MNKPTLDHIMTVASGYGVSRILLAATGAGLFGRLAQGGMTLSEIRAAYNLRERPAMDMLDLLVSVDLLNRTGDGPSAVYSNTDETATYLDPAKPGYIGGILELWDKRNYRYWDTIFEATQTGEPQNESKTKETGFFETLYAEPARLEAFMAAMNGSSLHAFEELARVFPFETYQSVTDIGGADALLSRLLARAHNHLECASFDLPEVTAIAQRRVVEDSLEHRITCVSGDFFQDGFPSADVITMGMILHDWDLEQKYHLIQKAYETLQPSGALIVIEALIDDARRENTYGLFMSLTMLMEFGDRAFDFSAAEFETWAREIGFKRFETYSLTGITRAVVAFK